MTERIEPGCMAVTVHVPPSEIPAGVLVRVIDRVDELRVRVDLSLLRAHCGACAQWVTAYLNVFGVGDHWTCEIEDAPPGYRFPQRGAMPERVLRRLPPPDLAGLTTKKRDEVPA